jgi:hypothetical protein
MENCTSSTIFIKRNSYYNFSLGLTFYRNVISAARVYRVKQKTPTFRLGLLFIFFCAYASTSISVAPSRRLSKCPRSRQSVRYLEIASALRIAFFARVNGLELTGL